MADHDLAAELQGYRNELANVEAAGKDERAAAVREEISRVEEAVRERADALDQAAEAHDKAGQDIRAAEARVESRRYRDLLDDPKPAARRGGGRPRKETAEDKTPKEKA